MRGVLGEMVFLILTSVLHEGVFPSFSRTRLPNRHNAHALKLIGGVRLGVFKSSILYFTLSGMSYAKKLLSGISYL